MTEISKEEYLLARYPLDSQLREDREQYEAYMAYLFLIGNRKILYSLSRFQPTQGKIETDLFIISDTDT